MNWYYVEAGQQAGPVDDAQLENLRHSGRIQDDTLIWRDGMANWQPYSAAKAATPPPGAAASPPPAGSGAETTRDAVCIECGGIFNMDNMIRHGEGYVCANCKPVFIQKLREGVAGTRAARTATAATLEEVLARDYEHDLGGYLGRGWEVLKSNAGLIIGASVLVYLCIMVIQMVPWGIGWILSMIFTGPLMGGLWVFYLKNIRGFDSTIGDAFSGFGPRFGQLLLAKLIPGLLALVCIIPAGILLGIALYMFSNARNSGSGAEGLGTGLLIAGGLLGLVGACVMIYLGTCWTFALPLVADKDMGFWPAMSLSRKVVIKHWWMTFLVVIVIGLVGSAGIIACGVGVLVSGPVAFAAMGCAYDKLFGDLVQGGE